MSFRMTYKTRNGRMIFDANLQNRYEAWATIAMIQEIFEEPACGDCGSPDYRFVVRTSKNRDETKADYVFYELHCDNCSAKLEFGVTPDGKRMWPKRRDKDKNEIPNRGWTRYVAPNQASTAAVQDGGQDPGASGDPSGYDAPPADYQPGDTPF